MAKKTIQDDVDMDVEIHEIRNMLMDASLMKELNKGMRWAAVEANGTCHFFVTEAEACAFQRGWRACLGLDEMTGEAK